MNQSWMRADRFSDEYAEGINDFVRFVVEHGKGNGFFPCPCWLCMNKMRVTMEELQDHLMINKHGETQGQSSFDHSEACMRYADTVMIDESDHVEILKALEDDLRNCPKMFEKRYRCMTS